MATFTTNYNLRKPATSDFISVATDLNANYDIIDTEIKNRSNEIVALDTRLDTLETENDPKYGAIVMTAGQSIPDAALTKINFAANGATSGHFTLDTTGDDITTAGSGTELYAIMASAIFTGSATGNRRELQVQLDGVTTVDSVDILTVRGEQPTSIATYLHGCWILPLASGVVITAHVFQNSGGALSLTAARLALAKVRP